MKKILVWCCIAFFAVLWYLLIQNYKINQYFTIDAYKKNIEKYWLWVYFDEDISWILNNLYTNKGNKVFYEGALMTWVKAKWFIILDHFWIDKEWNVYLYGNKLSGLDWKSVKFYENNSFYIADKNWIYHIEWEHINLLKTVWKFSIFSWILHEKFARDDKYVYSYWRVASWANPNDITLFEKEPLYFVSSGNVFYWFNIVPWADAETFMPMPRFSGESLKYDAQDKNYKYYKGKIYTWDIVP